MAAELRQRKSELTEPLESVYFGGGTPSLLTADQLKLLLEPLKDEWDSVLEFTIEANPEDITPDQLNLWYAVGIRRISLGVQSFFDDELKWMNRNHAADTSREALELISNDGRFELSADLIFGVPGSDLLRLQENFEQLLTFDPDHISAYHLTLESNTPYQKLVRQGKYDPPAEANEHFVWISQFLAEHQYLHYEVSNYARAGKQAVHNSNYWERKPYLGIGPGAHSFSGILRRWNVSNNKFYVESDLTGDHWFEQEQLSAQDEFNEQVLTGLRTAKGINMEELAFTKEERRLATDLTKNELAKMKGQNLILTRRGWLMADSISSEFFRLQ